MRDTKTDYRIEQVEDWIENDDSLEYWWLKPNDA